MNPPFTKNGELEEGFYFGILRRMDYGETIKGEDAAAFLAEEFASETSGNYSANCLYGRVELCKHYEISMKKRTANNGLHLTTKGAGENSGE